MRILDVETPPFDESERASSPKIATNRLSPDNDKIA